MLAKCFSIIRNYVSSVFPQRKYTFCHQNMLLNAYRTNSRNIIGKNPSMVIPLLAKQDLTPLLYPIINKKEVLSSTRCEDSVTLSLSSLLVVHSKMYSVSYKYLFFSLVEKNVKSFLTLLFAIGNIAV